MHIITYQYTTSLLRMIDQGSTCVGLFYQHTGMQLGKLSSCFDNIKLIMHTEILTNICNVIKLFIIGVIYLLEDRLLVEGPGSAVGWLAGCGWWEGQGTWGWGWAV